MSKRSWTRNVFARPVTRPIRQAPPRARLAVEGLESRNVLSSFLHLDPGGPANLPEQVPVNFVFVGYTPAQVSQSGFLSSLPASYDPIVRSRNFYGITEQVGLHYTYDYRVTYADAAFQNAFFGALRGLAVKQPAPTAFQQMYNDQANNVKVVTDNYFIDAPSVEKWLAGHNPAGVDTRQDTVFFINWWGRSDFVFHTYVKTGEPDPDTGMDFGATRDSRKLIAWGGTPRDDEESGLGGLGTHRIWFHDLSAGPDSWTGSWNVDDPDLDGDGSADYRLPAIWEYLTPGGYRSAAALTGDLGKIARYVALDLLFTPSPVYPTSLTPNRLPDKINLDLNTYEGIPGVDASKRFQNNKLLVQELGELYRIPFTVDNQDLVFAGDAKDSWLGFFNGTVTHAAQGNTNPFANLFYDAALKQNAFLDGPAPGHGEYVYEAVGLNYAVKDEEFGFFLGAADDNARNGTQSFVYNAVAPFIADIGYGLTTTQIHEYGHHFGMSHPHDGYDPAVNTGIFPPGEFGPTGPYYFAWVGDQVNSMMSYIDVNWDFSQFDRDNANRYLAAGYVRAANQIAADILAAPRVPAALSVLDRADVEIGMAKSALAAHDYVATFDHARKAYNLVLTGAAIANVPVLPSNDGRTLPPGTSGGGSSRTRFWYAVEEGFGPLGPGTRWFADDGIPAGEKANRLPSRLADESSPSSLVSNQEGASSLTRFDLTILNGMIGAGVTITASTTGTPSLHAAQRTSATGFMNLAPPALNSLPVPAGRFVPSVSRSDAEPLLATEDARPRIMEPPGYPLPALEHVEASPRLLKKAVGTHWAPTVPREQTTSTASNDPSAIAIDAAFGEEEVPDGRPVQASEESRHSEPPVSALLQPNFAWGCVLATLLSAELAAAPWGPCQTRRKTPGLRKSGSIPNKG